MEYQLPPDLIFKFEDIVLEKRTVGEGGYGVIHKGIVKKTQENVAVKCAKTSMKRKKKGIKTPESNYNTKRFYREVEFLHRAQGEGVVELKGVVDDDRGMYIVFPYMLGGDLNRSLNDLDTQTCLSFALTISKTMQRLHSVGIIHRDIKPHNFLLDENKKEIVLCDFGEARNKGEKMTPVVGTREYMAPEVSTDTYDHKVDVYSFGKLLWHMVTKTVPLVNENLLKYDKNVPPDLERLIKSCCMNPAKDRPEFSDITRTLQQYIRQISGSGGSSKKITTSKSKRTSDER